MHNCHSSYLHHLFFFFLLLFCFALSGCSKEKETAAKNELEYTVVSGADIPKELSGLIKEREKKAFELTFSDNACLYIVKGYGKQASGGYSIAVNDFYQENDELIFDTELYGPKKGDAVSETPSYPYIAIKAEYRENPVVFR